MRLILIWAMFVLFLCLTLYMIGAGAHFLAIKAKHALRRPSGMRTRNAYYTWQVMWSKILWRFLAFLMRIRVRYRFPEKDTEEAGPAIVIANHRSAMDMFLVPDTLSRIGFRKLLAIAKDRVKKVPFIGPSGKATGCAFVHRDGRPEDKEAVRACARRAAEDGSTIVIFPEGTRFKDDDDDGSTYTHLRQPRAGGLEEIIRILPDRPIVSITFSWTGTSARTLLDFAKLFGTKIEADIRYVRIHGAVKDWLRMEWRIKDAIISRTGT